MPLPNILSGGLKLFGPTVLGALINKVAGSRYQGSTTSTTQGKSTGTNIETTEIPGVGTGIKIGDDHPAYKWYKENQKELEPFFGELLKSPEKYPEMSEIVKAAEEAHGTGPELPEMPPEQQFPEFNFDPYAQRARRQFEEQTLPGLAERFTTLTGGGQRSGAFERQKTQAGVDLEERLAALRAQLEPEYALQKAKYGISRGALAQGLGGLALQKEGLRRGGIQSVMQQLSEARKPEWEQREMIMRLLGAAPQPYQAFQPAGSSIAQSFAPAIGQSIGRIGSLALKHYLK